MIFHENRLLRLLANDSREILFLFFRKFRKMLQNLLSPAVVIGALRVMIKKLVNYQRTSPELKSVLSTHLGLHWPLLIVNLKNRQEITSTSHDIK